MKDLKYYVDSLNAVHMKIQKMLGQDDFYRLDYTGTYALVNIKDYEKRAKI